MFCILTSVGPAGVFRSRTRNSIQDVKASDRFHGHVAQKRRGRETAVEIHIAHDRGRFHNVLDRISGRRPIRFGRVYQRNIISQTRRREPPPPSQQRQRKRGKTPSHALLQILD